MLKHFLDKIRLIAGIHTISIITPTRSKRIPEDTPYLHADARIIPGRCGSPDRYMYRLNPNNTEAGELYTFSGFLEVLDCLIDDMGLRSFYINRLDFRLDRFEGDYEDLRKMNKLLLLL